MRLTIPLVILILISPHHLRGQEAPAVVGSGYTSGRPRLAPGQLVTLFVTGIGDTRRVVADKLPLPTELAGISVTLTQGVPSPPQDILPTKLIQLPVLSVEVTSASPTVTAVTVQIPFEMEVGRDAPGPERGLPPWPADNASLLARRNGLSGPRIAIFPAPDSVHVLTTCDQRFRFVDSPEPCEPLVTHADGSRVRWSNPARAGEVLVMYAFGLGPTTPRVPSGAPTPAPLAMDERLWPLDFEFRPNVLPRRTPPLERAGDFDRLPQPLYVGLVPGFVGLYQINFRIPEQIPTGLPRCGDYISSNLTVTIFGRASSDGARICLQGPA